MGCNAHNHPPDCQCGWGGDTGGTSSYRRGVEASFADGRDWGRSREALLDSYVNPNARCPVCGAEVFFYRSPHDGRVFFDSLGPPWPKHPCTDTARLGIVHRPNLPRKRLPPKLNSPWEWQPLLSTKVILGVDFDLFYLDKKETGFSGRFIPMAAGMYLDAPKYWRRHRADPRFVEVSTICRPSWNPGSMKPRWSSQGTNTSFQERLTFGMMTENFFAPGWMNDPEDIEQEMQDIDASGSIWNAAAWSLSFHWKHLGTPDWDDDRRIDWALAKSLFEKAASLGFWAAANNLGVIYRDGLGHLADPEQAFHWFTIAAESLEPISLGHLAQCYLEGIGTAKNTEYSSYLEDLAKMVEADSQ